MRGKRGRGDRAKEMEEREGGWGEERKTMSWAQQFARGCTCRDEEGRGYKRGRT